MTEAMAVKASAIEIEELKTVMTKPTPSPEAAEMAIWRHFGEMMAGCFGDCEAGLFGDFLTCLFSEAMASLEFIGAPTSSLVQQIACWVSPIDFLEPQTFLGEAMNLDRAHNCHFHYARCRANQLRDLDSQPDR